jgi:hypothetical protein
LLLRVARIDIGESLAGRVLHDVATRDSFGSPVRRQAAALITGEDIFDRAADGSPRLFFWAFAAVVRKVCSNRGPEKG